ncbi:alpha-(1,3)-fucosyltransferase 7-like [Pollicipes pollicipes]|uniref:alpha-(1,3)-fucosyltransferase 7-like n=1 Tax=Pollicipes pollicipes TaxID=41117 RepID=UPI00188573BC|nr:alpha-(1,3)-fucosyltransferase 7-like [Pollicipes pollicipes]
MRGDRDNPRARSHRAHVPSRRWRRLLLLLLVPACLVYLFYDFLEPHFMAAGWLVQNRYWHQWFYRAPELSSDLDNASLVLYWTPVFHAAVNGDGMKPFAHCPVNNCVGTNDRRFLSRARAVLFHGYDISMWDVPHERTVDQLYVFWSHEAPPMLNVAFGALNSAFNLTMTYRLDSDVVSPYFEVIRRNRSATVAPAEGAGPTASGAPTPPGGPEPTVAWVASHCTTPSRREQYVAELQRYLPVHVFGACGTRECGDPAKRRDTLACFRQLVGNYTFYLAFENSLCRDYITEKLFRALQVGLVPVVRGAPRASYAAVAPPDSFVHVDDFAGPRELAAHLRHLARNASALTRLTAWRDSFTVRPVEGWCRLCARMLQPDGPVPARYDDLRRWWNDGSHCRS